MLITMERPSDMRFSTIECLAYRLIDGEPCKVETKSNTYIVTYASNCLEVLDKREDLIHTIRVEHEEYSIAKAFASIWQSIAWLL